MSQPAHQPRPLLVTADPVLLDELLRLTSGVGVEPHVAPDPTAARRYWSRAPCVVVGHDAAETCAEAGLPPRDHLAVLLPDDPGARAMPWGAAGRLGAGYVAPVTAARAWLTGWFDPGGGTPVAPVIGVVGGGGGAGASVVATVLALLAVRAGQRTLLLDLDPAGGGLDLLLGWEGRSGCRWPELEALAELPGDLHEVLPSTDGLALLSVRCPDEDHLEPSPPVSARVASRVLDLARRTYDLIVVDLPRRPDEAAARIAERCTGAYLVVRGDVHGSAAARNVVGAYAPLWEPPGLLVRRTPGVVLPAENIAATLGLSVAGVYDADTEITNRVHGGVFERLRARGDLAGLCGSLLDDLAVA